MYSSYAPIVVFAYKRKDKLQCCLDALSKNDIAKDSHLIIYSDGYKGKDDRKQVEEVQEYLDEYSKTNKKFNQIILYKSAFNKGLANSVIFGVSQVIKEYGRVIVVEDDLIVSSDFLRYMNEALMFYEKAPEYGAISAYTYPLKELKRYKRDVYVMRKGDCWGGAHGKTDGKM